MSTKTIFIIGAGVMGSSTALDLACYGYKVILKDINQDILEKARQRITEELRAVKMLKTELRAIDSEVTLSNIVFQNNYNNYEKADLVIENAVEDFAVKQKIYKELCDLQRNDLIFAINTSCISITKIASFLPDPTKVIGTHFMNPVPFKSMVEVIKGYHTSEETEKTIIEFLKTLKKKGIVINDMPGFVSNRVSHLFMNEAAFLVQDNVADPNQIDTIFRDGYGHKMGPLQTADLIGLDTVVKSLDVLYQNYQDPKFRCCPLLRKMVDAGLLGKKSGKGFYEYKYE